MNLYPRSVSGKLLLKMVENVSSLAFLLWMMRIVQSKINRHVDRHAIGFLYQLILEINADQRSKTVA